MDAIIISEVRNLVQKSRTSHFECEMVIFLRSQIVRFYIRKLSHFKSIIASSRQFYPMRGWIAAALLFILLNEAVVSLSVQTQRAGLSVTGKFSDNDHSIDTSLYSRQLFVYGESAQLALKRSTILLIGSGALNAEIVKNVALTGMGKMVFVNFAPEQSTTQQLSLLGTNKSAAQYAAELNRNVVVRTHNSYFNRIDISHPSARHFQVVEAGFTSGDGGWTQLLREHNITAVVASNTNFTVLNELDLSCQQAGVKLVACGVHGVCGYVFNNFQREFRVVDADGEERKEVHHFRLHLYRLIYLRI